MVSYQSKRRPGYVAPRGGRSSNSHSGYSGVSYGNVAASVGNHQVTVRGTHMSDVYLVVQSVASGVTPILGLQVHVLLVSSIEPAPGAIFQSSGGYYGHVGIVDRVENGRVFVSDMNFAGV